MGKGSSPRSNVAIKEVRAVSTGVEGAGGQSEQSSNICLFQFTEHLLLRVGNGIAVGDAATIVPSATNAKRLDIYIGSALVGRYDGQYVDRILTCINEDYSYRGVVDTVNTVGNGVEVTCTIAGHSYE